MRFLIVTSSYPDRNEGQAAAGVFVKDLALEISKNVPTMVCAPSLDPREETPNNNLRVSRFAVPKLPLSLLSPAKPGHWPKILNTLRSGQRACNEAVEQFLPTHVLALWTLPCGAWALKAARSNGIPVAIWALGSDIWSLKRIPVVRSILRRTLRNCNVRFADGLELASDVSTLANAPCGFLPSVSNLPIESPRKLNSRPPYRIAFLGRWHPNKGIDIAMGALESLSDSDWSQIEQVKIFGGGPLEDAVIASGNRLRSRGRPIEIGGFVDRNGAAQLFNWCDWVLLPSRIESIPVVFGDALQARRPLVASPVGDIPRLFHQCEVGILAQQVNEACFASALRAALGKSPDEYLQQIDELRKEFEVPSTAVKLLNAKTWAGMDL